ncbi:MAG: aliphatic sulfonate ABC transporter substrate-binding protein [Abitibacteriaceae bacterium]|nr:aliphatic sulfonate ABC transporter substrate-binding protein [Abditibacteriaceae bacterium]
MYGSISIKKRLLWSSIALTSMLLAGCGSNGQNTNSTSTDTTAANSSTNGTAAGGDVKSVTIGYTPTIVLPQPLVGLQKGEYAKQVPGVTFGSTLYEAGSGVIEALRSGVIDIGASGPYPALKAYAKSGDIVLLANAANGGTELMVSKSGPVKTIKDLKGKAVGVNQVGSTVDAMVRYNLLQAGLKPDTDVRIVQVAPGEQAATLQGGQIAGVAAPAPWPSQVAAKGNGRPLIDWKQILDNGNYSAGSIYTTKKFADAHPDFIKKFVAAHQAITDALNKDRTKGDADVLAAWSAVSKKTLDPAVAKAAFATIKYTTDPDPKNLQRFADIAFQVGVLKKKADLTGFVYTAK